MKFEGKVLVIGCGSVAQCAIPLIPKILGVPPANVSIIDFADNRSKIKSSLKKGMTYDVDRITPENYTVLLKEYVGPGDLIIDLAWNIEAIDMLQWCRDNGVLYVNTSVEEWDPYKDEERKDPTKYTLYARQMDIRERIRKWGDNEGPTAIVDHGANPGLVSHFTKYALIDIARKIIMEKPNDRRRAALEEALDKKDFPMLAMLSGTKVIHISERDTQITDRPKEVNEFVNTWSIEGFYEEGVAPAELGWGTHEQWIPKDTHFHKSGPRNQICLESIGMKTWVRSWVPCGEITGMVIRHGEAFGISDRLTVWRNGEAVYRPTVHYAYCPSDCAINSLHELEMRNFKMQEKQRIMADEIIDGRDELGVLLMGHDFKSWWMGSLLDIHTARKLVPHQQATTLQVAISAVAAAKWAIKNPRRGYNLPDDLDHDYILNICRPYIKPLVSQPVDWTPLKHINRKFVRFDGKFREDDVWQFVNFMVDREMAAMAKRVAVKERKPRPAMSKRRAVSRAYGGDVRLQV
jgi:homospermidine synthase